MHIYCNTQDITKKTIQSNIINNVTNIERWDTKNARYPHEEKKQEPEKTNKNTNNKLQDKFQLINNCIKYK